METILNQEERKQYNRVAIKLKESEDRELLNEHIVSLSKCVVNIDKNKSVNLENSKAKVVVILDYSASMRMLYNNGTVQRTLNKLVPIGLTFDDNGEIEVYLFNQGYRKFDNMNISNYKQYKYQVIDKAYWSMGMTAYAPVLRAVLEDTGKIKKAGLFKNKTKCIDDGDDVFVIFITDGETNSADRNETNKVIRLSSQTNTYIQFIGIGDTEFGYLETLDTIGGRKIDNTGFSSMKSLEKASDEELYNTILSGFAEWIKQRKETTV